MTETKFTPGPWVQSHRRCPDEMFRTQVYPANDPDNTIATLHWHSVKTETGFKTDRDENANLIAASPELYEATEPFDELFTHHAADAPEWNDHDRVTVQLSIGDLRAIKAARTKARGES